MSINKNFVVKNGLEVNTDLILADAPSKRVGIGSTIPAYTLDVIGGIGATDLNVVGLATVLTEFNVGTNGSVLTVLGVGGSIGVGTAFPQYLLDVVSPVSFGATALYVKGDADITGRLYVDNIEVGNIYSTGIATIPSLDITSATLSNILGTNLSVTGFTTLSDYVDINNSVDISADLNVVGLTTIGGFVDINDSVDISTDLNVSGIVTAGSVSIGATQVISSTFELQNILSLDATTTATIESAVANAPNTFTDLNVSGITTLSGNTTIGGATTISGFVDINDSVDISGSLNVGAATTIGGFVDINDSVDVSGSLNIVGVVTASAFYGDGSNLTGGGIGIQSTGQVVGYGITLINFRGSAVSTIESDPLVGIATITVVGGSGGGGAAGNDGQIQYALSGSLAATPNFVWDGGTLNIFGSSIGIGTTAIYARSTGASFQTVETSNVAIKSNSVGIGTTNPVYTLQVVGGGTSLGGDVLVGNNINISGVCTATDFDALSDINYKVNIETVSNALSKVDQLRGVRFDWKESGEPSYGVVAQELETVLPELVKGSDPKTVNYNGIIGVLIEAIKELKTEIEELKSNSYK